MPAGLVDGINYNTADATRATVVLDAPLKILYIAGSFNNWQPTNSYAMKRSCFWKILVGIKWFGIGVNYSYQYWVGNNSLVNSAFGKTADPYSTLVLSHDDPLFHQPLI
jgi:hypothetical protein